MSLSLPTYDAQSREPVNDHRRLKEPFPGVGCRNAYHLHPGSARSLNPGRRIFYHHTSLNCHAQTFRPHEIGLRRRLALPYIISRHKYTRNRQTRPPQSSHGKLIAPRCHDAPAALGEPFQQLGSSLYHNDALCINYLNRCETFRFLLGVQIGSYEPDRFDSSDPVRNLHNRGHFKTVPAGPCLPMARNATRRVDENTIEIE